MPTRRHKPRPERTSEPPRRLSPWEQSQKLGATPQAQDLYGAAPLPGSGGRGTQLTPSQAVALTLAHRRAATLPSAAEESGIPEGMARPDDRIALLNQTWGTSYAPADLARVRDWLARAPLTVNLTLGGRRSPESPTLAARLREGAGLMNQWQTGTTGASNDLDRRAAAERWMGYGLPLGRITEPGQAGGMPLYAALNVTGSSQGSAPQYGVSHLVLKESVRARATLTPTDSFVHTYAQETRYSTARYALPATDPLGLILSPRTPPRLLRLAFAEATGCDTAWRQSPEAGRAPGAGEYVEAQIHGGIAWRDIAEIVVSPAEADASRIVADFQEFARAHPGLSVRLADGR
ncbi:DUF3626 domain-containing protein [Streptomyces sp. HUAS TT7]|uniref:DUF3626 domain-containing protein n=1 Tax=Streptomyces sp. HUAS TT7 TaxID=3447507 RepID=UPI003F659A42